jgi:hypothetical protein
MRGPLFVCGFPSGGTDLLKTILNAHPDVYLNGEMPFLVEILQLGYRNDTSFSTSAEIEAFVACLEKLDEWRNLENIDFDFSVPLAGGGMLTLEQVMHRVFRSELRLVWGNKTPQNTEHIEELVQLFPNAKFLVITRDVRDVCLSQSRKWGKDMSLCADNWNSRMKAGWVASERLEAGRCHYLKFEDLLLDTECAVRKICDFLDIPFSPLMLTHHEHIEKDIDGKINYGQPVITSNREKWRTILSSNAIFRIESVAFDSMKLFGYEVEYAEHCSALTITEKIFGKLCNVTALVAVGNRTAKNNGITSRVQNVFFELKKLFRKSRR